MNEETEFWKQYKQEQKERRQEKSAAAFEELEPLCKEFSLRLEKIQPWHFRLNGNTGALDIYPQRKRWHWLPDNSRGGYRHMRNLLLRFFNEAKK